MMIDVTDLFVRYRECARHVWNTAFRDLQDGWHSFINVDDALFSALVLTYVDETHDWSVERRQQCYPSLRARPRFGPIGFRVMWARENPRNHWEWTKRQLPSTAVELAYISYFDFANTDAPLDFQYVRARILSCDEFPELVGADALLEALQVDIHAMDPENGNEAGVVG